MASLFEAQQAHEMQAVRVTRVERQRLLATDLRVEVSTGLQVAVTGFRERGDAVTAGRCQPGCLGRGAAFARVHLRIPGRLRISLQAI